MKCPKCNNEITENQKFCPNCGMKLNTEKTWFQENAHTLTILAFLVIAFSTFVLYNNSIYNTYTKHTQPSDAKTNKSLNNSTSDIKEEKYIAQKPKCIYETSNGVCFTTKTFKPKAMNYYECTGGLTTYEIKESSAENIAKIGINYCYDHYDYWAGAMKMCSDWGYKLSSAYDLASLAVDIYKVTVSNQNGVHTYLPDGFSLNNIPLNALNIEPNNVIEYFTSDEYGINDYNNDTHSFVSTRQFYSSATYFRKYSYKTDSMNGSYYFRALCVYNPNGKVKTSYQDYLHEQKIKEQKKQAEKEQMEIEQRANSLF